MSSYTAPPAGDVPAQANGLPVAGVEVIGAFQLNGYNGWRFLQNYYNSTQYQGQQHGLVSGSGAGVGPVAPPGAKSYHNMTVNLQCKNTSSAQQQDAAANVAKAGAIILADFGSHDQSAQFGSTNGSTTWGQLSQDFSKIQFVLTDDQSILQGTAGRVFRENGVFTDYLDVNQFSSNHTYTSSPAVTVGALLHEFGHI